MGGIVMEEKDVTYYLIYDHILGKSVGRYDYFLYKNNKWERDSNWIILGKLCGYDDTEPAGSPYGFGSTSVMDEIKEISKEEADKFIKKSKRQDLIEHILFGKSES